MIGHYLVLSLPAGSGTFWYVPEPQGTSRATVFVSVQSQWQPVEASQTTSFKPWAVGLATHISLISEHHLRHWLHCPLVWQLGPLVPEVGGMWLFVRGFQVSSDFVDSCCTSCGLQLACLLLEACICGDMSAGLADQTRVILASLPCPL